MNKLMVTILIISIIGNIVGVVVFYKYWSSRAFLRGSEIQVNSNRQTIDNLNDRIADLTESMDKFADNRMVFLHHSVGNCLLNDGGLRNQLLDMGILVKSATYGDDIGEDTDINHWAGKFEGRMNDIFRFANHGDKYYGDETANDIVMFKSCFPNSNIAGEGTGDGDPTSPERTVANYKAVFTRLKADMKQYPNRLFIYLTAPPLNPDKTNPENAARAKQFNDWLLSEFQPGYLGETGVTNFYVFDLFGVLADENNVLRNEYRRAKPGDSHPNQNGSTAAVAGFIDFFKPIWIKWQNEQNQS